MLSLETLKSIALFALVAVVAAFLGGCYVGCRIEKPKGDDEVSAAFFAAPVRCPVSNSLSCNCGCREGFQCTCASRK